MQGLRPLHRGLSTQGHRHERAAESLRLSDRDLCRHRGARDAASASWPVPNQAPSRYCGLIPARWTAQRSPEIGGTGGDSMSKQLMKGNEALMKSAILSGCRAFYGYPITPASEITEAAALYMPQAGGVFLQAESEVAAINMLYGASSAGIRCMTASSGPGISLMQEGVSYMAGRGTALRDRRHHARRSGPGQHCRRAERLPPGGQRRRQRQLSHPGRWRPIRRRKWSI